VRYLPEAIRWLQRGHRADTDEGRARCYRWAALLLWCDALRIAGAGSRVA